MKTRSNAIFAGIFGLAVVATAVMFVIPRFMSDPPPYEGSLSQPVVKLESEYKVLQDEWKAGESSFRTADKSITAKLTDFQKRLRELSVKANAQLPATPAEKD